MIVAIGICLFASACSDERPYGPVVDEKNALEIIVSINEEQQTKADGEIKDDVDIDTDDKAQVTYYFSYVEKSSADNFYTTIDVTGTENNVSDKDWEGRPYKTKEPQDQLTWGDINLKSRHFILDNIQYNVREKPTSSQTISFPTGDDGSGYSKYDAAPAPEIVGTGNDILWGQLEVSKQQGEILNPLHFELEHKMSKVTFVIFSEEEKVQSSLKESGVNVTLSGVILKSASFNRLTGKVIAGKSKSDQQLNGEFENGSYITKAWIFPPQIFGDEDRPKLSVQVGGVTYTGPLNASMQIENSITKPLEFLAGYHLIIEAELGNFNDRNIYFEPVLVEKWNVLPDKDLSVGQVGIRTTEELRECMDAFSKISSLSSSDENIWILRKYGVQNGDSWTFYLWKDLTDVCDEAFNEFLTSLSSSHTFQWNGHTINEKGESSFKKDTE